MPVRYIGRDPFFKGRPLYEIVRHLRNLGEGRVVYRNNYMEQWPTQKTFVRLRKVVPDMAHPPHKQTEVSEAFGFLVYRGREVGDVKLMSGKKPDWILVPKEEEEEFCRITDVQPEEELPTHFKCPPMLELVQKAQLKARREEVPDEITIPYVRDRPFWEIRRHIL